jgi:hypothetical protein
MSRPAVLGVDLGALPARRIVDGTIAVVYPFIFLGRLARKRLLLSRQHALSIHTALSLGRSLRNPNITP